MREVVRGAGRCVLSVSMSEIFDEITHLVEYSEAVCLDVPSPSDPFPIWSNRPGAEGVGVGHECAEEITLGFGVNGDDSISGILNACQKGMLLLGGIVQVKFVHAGFALDIFGHGQNSKYLRSWFV